MTLRGPAVVGAVLVAALLAGCSGPSAATSSSGHTIALATQPASAAEEALAQGSVSWGDDGCLVLDGDQPVLVVFPYGTRLDGDTVTLPGGETIEAGDDVALGGGFHDVVTSVEKLADVPPDCLTPEVFWASGEVGE